MKSIRILIVDDQQLFAASLKTVLETMDSDFTVVGLAGDGEEALAVVDGLSPHIVLMDVRMPKLDGVETTRLLRFRRPDLPILMLTTFEDEEYVRAALRHGASGYMLKNISPAELVSCIHAVLNGAVSIDPRVLAGLIQPRAAASTTATASTAETGGTGGSGPLEGSLVSGGQGEGGAGPAASGGPAEGGWGARPAPGGTGAWADLLNRKEKQILGLMVQGFNNKEIASRLFIAEQTVRNYVSRIYEKLAVSDRVGAIRRARESGLY